jgi:hypothetical protein
MKCNICDESGVKDENHSRIYSKPSSLMPCEECDNDCEICSGSGWYTPEFSEDQKPCEACWVWESCKECHDGEIETGYFNPSRGTAVTEIIECDQCDGEGGWYTKWGGKPPHPETLPENCNLRRRTVRINRK